MITAKLEFKVLKGNYRISEVLSMVREMVGADGSHQSHNIGSTPEAIVVGEAAPGYALFFNDSADTDVTLEITSGNVEFAKIPPKGFALIPLATGAISAHTAAGTAQLIYWILDA